jgi:hypothetical protein
MFGTTVRRFAVAIALFALSTFIGCASDPHKTRPKTSHHPAGQSDFPTAAEAGLAPTPSATK